MVSTYPLRLSLLRPPLSSTFATRPVKLTETNVVDDAYRAANGGIQGDGLLGNQTTGIWPAATNLNDNGNVTTNLTGVTDHSSTTTRATTGVVKFGTTAFNVVSGNAAANEGPSQPINGGLGSTQYTVSAWVWLVSGAATVRATLSDTVAGKQGGTAVVLTATPQKVTVTATTGIAGITEASYIETTVQQAGMWRIGGWQVETGAVATPYVATDGGDATRGTGRVQVATNQTGLTSTVGAYVHCWQYGVSSTNVPGAGLRVGEWRVDNNNRFSFQVDSSARRFLRRVSGGVGTSLTASATTWAAGDYALDIFAWDGTTLYSSLNGAAYVTQANSSIPDLSSVALMDLGNDQGSNTQAGNTIWDATLSRVPTASEAATLYNAFGKATSPKPTLRGLIQAAPSSHPNLLWDGRTGIAQRRVAA